MTLHEYVNFAQDKGEEVSYTSIAKDIPCHFSYISLVARGKRRPSYDMARRIEQVTNGSVKRTNWYPDD